VSDAGAPVSGSLFPPQVSRMKNHANDRNDMCRHNQTGQPGPKVHLYFHLNSLAVPAATFTRARYPS